MILVLVILLAIALVIGVYFVMIYNALVQVKHNVSKAWANIEVLLKQRHDELPKLIETCKQYMKFEQDTLQRVIEARSRVHAAAQSQDIAALGPAEGALRMGLGNLFAQVGPFTDPSRTLLGAEQEAWLANRLRTSDARWKFVGQGVMFAQLKAQGAPVAAGGGLFFNSDQKIIFRRRHKTGMEMCKFISFK